MNFAPPWSRAFMGEEEVYTLAARVRGAQRYTLQNFNPRDPLDEALKSVVPFDEPTLRRMQERVNEIIKNPTALRQVLSEPNHRDTEKSEVMRNLSLYSLYHGLNLLKKYLVRSWRTEKEVKNSLTSLTFRVSETPQFRFTGWCVGLF